MRFLALLHVEAVVRAARGAMKFHRSLMASVFLVAAACATAADSATISGRVQNVVTGQYLNNARVSVRGTDIVVFTDQAGVYQIPSVPAGAVVLQVFYTDLDPQTITLEVSAGQSLEQDVGLTSVARYGAETGVVKLDSFVVATDRETDAQAIATNEQRFAPNIKNVMSTDALGDVMSSSVGEFLKFIPGVAAAYAAGSIEEVRLTRTERGYRGARDYHGYYPSVHLTGELRENLLARAAYAKTYGRPNFADIIPNATFTDNDLTDAQQADPSVIKGTITLRNTALKPWTADNYDLSLEYYTRQGGALSAGVFVKDIKDFFGTAVKVATAADVQLLGIDPRYVGWNINTKFNSGDARITGAEINLRHSLRALGSWGGFFTVFANGTKLKLEGDQQASFASFIPESANWGASFSRQRVSLVARWNYRGLDQLAAVPAFGADGFGYIQARTTLDLSFNFQLSRRLTFAASANNVFNAPQVALRYGSETPAYARQFNTREFGVVFAFGVKGTF